MQSFYVLPPTYDRVRLHIYSLRSRCQSPSLRVLPVGRSLLGRGIFAIVFGNPMSPNLMVGGVHGSEWITTMLMLKFADRLAEAIANKEQIAGMDVGRICDERSLAIIPALNPDGIEIALCGPDAAFSHCKDVLQMAGGTDIARWQANARGVDLNHNFNAGWQVLRQLELDAGITAPGPTKYGGERPHSEPESRAIAHYIQTYRPRSLYAFHSQGEEIYYRYGPSTPPRSEVVARMLGELSGYTVCDPTGTASHGGLKDWFIETYGRPGFTFEVGKGVNPLPIEDFPAIYERLEKTLAVAALL